MSIDATLRAAFSNACPMLKASWRHENCISTTSVRPALSSTTWPARGDESDTIWLSHMVRETVRLFRHTCVSSTQRLGRAGLRTRLYQATNRSEHTYHPYSAGPESARGLVCSLGSWPCVAYDPRTVPQRAMRGTFELWGMRWELLLG